MLYSIDPDREFELVSCLRVSDPYMLCTDVRGFRSTRADFRDIVGVDDVAAVDVDVGWGCEVDSSDGLRLESSRMPLMQGTTRTSQCFSITSCRQNLFVAD